MKEAIQPSASSKLCSYGSSEPVSDIPSYVDSHLPSLSRNVYGSSFHTEEQVYYNNCDQLMRDKDFAVPTQSTINYQPGPSSSMSINRQDHFHSGPQNDYLITAPCFDYIHHQQSFSVGKNLSVPEYETDLQVKNARKWSIEISDSEFNNPNSNKATLNEWTINKRKVVCIEEQEQEQRHHQVNEEAKEIQSRRLRVRRSQKLSDKITALQKLVSPYGKTDSASVLREASISIKVLQDQIQKLYQMLSMSCNNNRYLDLQNSRGKKQLDLRSRGLCLVPISFTQKLAAEKPS